MPQGMVKRFDDAKGFGFIVQDGLEKDVFVHHTAIVMNGRRTLREGQKVEYDLERSEKGLRAVGVRVVG